ncbi:puromycin-sensitive aminopeptidase-like protein, partial [Camponotus floridanus]|uniref:puromycin-sensitive aminopeptidase-like protein n=1 Tax=Camponotus floridanus TaxID=104421 RepID=UPI000DC6A073
MAILKLSINLRLIIATAILSVNGLSSDSVSVDEDSNNDSAINYRLPDNVVPVHYNIKLIPYIEANNFNFEGESSVDIIIRHATQNLSLHVFELTIDKTVTVLFDDNGIHVYTPATYNYDNITQILVLNFNNKLLPGNYILKLRFVGILRNDLKGFFILSYINEEGNNMWSVATHFEPIYARRTFPCWDEPALKATFDISIKHPRNYTALSNMPTREQSDDGNKDGMIWTHFDTTPIISTYLVAFSVVANYIRVPVDDTTNIWCRSKLVPHTKFVQEVVQKSKELLTEYTSIYKMPKMDLVALPQFIHSSISWGLIIFGETSLAYNESFNTISTKRDVAVTTVHGIAYQWFSNVVTPLWWPHVWLSEGFATFCEIYILNQIFEDWRRMEYFVVQQKILHVDIDMNINPITLEVNRPKEIESLFFHSNYNKASAILRMLQHIITDEIFEKGLIKYLHTQIFTQFNSTTSDSLWNAFQVMLDKSGVPHNTYRLKEVMDTWIKQSDFPVVYMTRNNDTNEIILTQEHFLPKNKKKNVSNNKWWIPLTFATQTNPDFSNTLPTHWLKPQDQNITINGIDPNDWIIVNLQQIGYYRVNYDSSNWQKIVSYLKSGNYMKIHVLNRAQIIDDAYYFMMLNKHDIMMFLNIISYLSQETDFIPWYSMLEVLKLTEDIYKVPENEFLKSYIIKILDALIKNVGYEEDPGEDDLTKFTRIEALKWACTLGHSECKKMATVKLNEFLADPKTYKISPNLKEWTYCNGLMEANASTWNKLFYIYVNKSDKETLMYLICSENPDIIINFL